MLLQQMSSYQQPKGDYQQQQQASSGGSKFGTRTSSLAATTGGPSVSGGGGLLQFVSIPLFVSVFIIFLFFFVLIGFFSFRVGNKTTGCLGPPYLLVTSSDQRNIVQLSRDGCVTLKKALWNVPDENIDMRSMAIGQYNGQAGHLYVANAGGKTSESAVLVFGDCSYWNSLRTYKTKLMSSTSSVFSKGAKHVYGVAFDPLGNLYASFQHTCVILRAEKDTWMPLPSPLVSGKGSGESTSTSATTSVGGGGGQF